MKMFFTKIIFLRSARIENHKYCLYFHSMVWRRSVGGRWWPGGSSKEVRGWLSGGLVLLKAGLVVV
jgi:hypothetical protein